MRGGGEGRAAARRDGGTFVGAAQVVSDGGLEFACALGEDEAVAVGRALQGLEEEAEEDEAEEERGSRETKRAFFFAQSPFCGQKDTSLSPSNWLSGGCAVASRSRKPAFAVFLSSVLPLVQKGASFLRSVPSASETATRPESASSWQLPSETTKRSLARRRASRGIFHSCASPKARRSSTIFASSSVWLKGRDERRGRAKVGRFRSARFGSGRSRVAQREVSRACFRKGQERERERARRPRSIRASPSVPGEERESGGLGSCTQTRGARRRVERRAEDAVRRGVGVRHLERVSREEQPSSRECPRREGKIKDYRRRLCEGRR